MANVANSKATGPASKNTVSGGKTFPLDGKAGASSNGIGVASGNEVQRVIMGMRATLPEMSSDVQSGIMGNKSSIK